MYVLTSLLLLDTIVNGFSLVDFNDPPGQTSAIQAWAELCIEAIEMSILSGA